MDQSLADTGRDIPASGDPCTDRRERPGEWVSQEEGRDINTRPSHLRVMNL